MNKSNDEKRIVKDKFLDSKIFFGLKNLNDGFDSKSIKYFSEFDFDIVLDRIEKHGIGIYGIEPWLNGEFFDVLSYEDFSNNPADPNWYRKKHFQNLLNAVRNYYIQRVTIYHLD